MEPLGPEVRHELGRHGAPEGMADLVAMWAGAVGPQIAENAWPARTTRDGTLVVHARDSIWAFELTQQAEEIGRRLGVKAPKFVPGPVPESPAETTSTARTTVRPATLEEARTASEWAAPIEDPELRALVARAARASLAKAAAARPSDHRF
jgi:Dna[CI] antecedent, DciA